MIKKLFIHIILILFTTSVVAEEILMDCKTGKYRYIKQDSETTILYTHKKRDKGKWAGWCPSEVTEDNKAWFVSAKDLDLLITDRKGICMVSEGKFKMTNGKIGIVKSIIKKILLLSLVFFISCNLIRIYYFILSENDWGQLL